MADPLPNSLVDTPAANPRPQKQSYCVVSTVEDLGVDLSPEEQTAIQVLHSFKPNSVEDLGVDLSSEEQTAIQVLHSLHSFEPNSMLDIPTDKSVMRPEQEQTAKQKLAKKRGRPMLTPLMTRVPLMRGVQPCLVEEEVNIPMKVNIAMEENPETPDYRCTTEELTSMDEQLLTSYPSLALWNQLPAPHSVDVERMGHQIPEDYKEDIPMKLTSYSSLAHWNQLPAPRSVDVERMGHQIPEDYTGFNSIDWHAFDEFLDSFAASSGPYAAAPEEPIVEEQSARTTAPRDINLNMDGRNILPGNLKRQRTKSSRAAGTASY
ncbi:hypothetical protein GGX14DRAFT_576162 [Mycena pura]|uniref:Uncharacterized protein n=1 Tax=Mycena pura TaxID=153505 RepID=A0AAD6Y034_9AGAR|nr:hypothetical protein GGX14DRAFT_576162 [Mycena pura]